MTTTGTITSAAEIAGSINQNNLSIFSLLMTTDIVGKTVLLILIFSSIWSWAIIFEKLLRIRSIKKKIHDFEAIFWSGQVLDQLFESTKRKVDNPLASVFVSAMSEFKRTMASTVNESTSLKIGQKDRVLQAMNLVRNKEMENLSKNLVFLATVGSSATFIGLFGMIWGVMHSFQSIAASKNTSLAVMAPGLSEALFVTAMGLVAAIPASAMYNVLSAKIEHISNKIEDFISELNTILSRAIDEERN